MYTETKKYTYDDYAKLPESAPYQLINGELIISATPNIYHQTILMNILSELIKYNADMSLGKFSRLLLMFSLKNMRLISRILFLLVMIGPAY
ncbi:MAG: hypothetical protein R6W90_15455 [Ignavibacteriaceae bacterium]